MTNDAGNHDYDDLVPVDPHDDDQLLRALGAALDAADPQPSHLSEYARALFELGGLDAELAELTFDSLAGSGAAMRAPGASPRVLVYGGAMFSVELEFIADAVLGQVVPGGPARITLQTPSGSTQAAVDDDGSFAFEMPAVPVRLLVERHDDRLVTPWVEADDLGQPAP